MDSRAIYFCMDYQDYDFKSDRIWRTDCKYEPFVYIIQEVETGMKYIGSKTQKGCLESWLGTKYFTSSDCVEWTNHEFEILDIISCASNHDALILEELLIKFHDAVKNDMFYNRNCNGALWNLSGLLGDKHPAHGTTRSEETRRKIALSKMGDNNPWRKYKQTEEHKKKNSDAHKGENNAMYGKFGINHPAYGYRHSEEDIKRRLESRKNYRHSEETKKKIGEKSLGRKHSEETKKKLSEANSGERNGNYGKTHTQESRKKISEAAKNRPKKKCEHCNGLFSPGTLSRWHGNNCKHRS